MVKRRTKYMVLVNDEPRRWNPKGPCFSWIELKTAPIESMVCSSRKIAEKRIEKDKMFTERNELNAKNYRIIRVSFPPMQQDNSAD